MKRKISKDNMIFEIKTDEKWFKIIWYEEWFVRVKIKWNFEKFNIKNDLETWDFEKIKKISKDIFFQQVYEKIKNDLKNN